MPVREAEALRHTTPTIGGVACLCLVIVCPFRSASAHQQQTPRPALPQLSRPCIVGNGVTTARQFSRTNAHLLRRGGCFPVPLRACQLVGVLAYGLHSHRQHGHSVYALACSFQRVKCMTHRDVIHRSRICANCQEQNAKKLLFLSAPRICGKCGGLAMV